MPIVAQSTYRPPLYLRNGHLQTIFPSLFRRLKCQPYQRERIETPDKDFLDLDWAVVGGPVLGIISHGLEGNSRRPYAVGMARMFNQNGWDALAWNYRSCSGEINHRLRFYHNGSIDDLDTVVNHAIETGKYDRIVLVGFSMGGNLTLVYLGKRAQAIDKRIDAAVVFSAPCDLAASAHALARRSCRLYMKSFLTSLHKKIKAKSKLMPGRLDDHDFHRIKNFKDYDDRYTAPLHGFKDAEDYWRKCSSVNFICGIKVPTLIVNARNDPFLAGRCYPTDSASQSDYVHLETPAWGGHVGFIEFNCDRQYWSEKRAFDFIHQCRGGRINR